MTRFVRISAWCVPALIGLGAAAVVHFGTDATVATVVGAGKSDPKSGKADPKPAAKKKASGGETAAKVLAPAPRPKRPDLPPSKLPLDFIKGERVAFLGNSLAERFSIYGHFETLLHARFAARELVVRNFARPAEEVAVHQRSADYTKLDDPQAAFGADTYFLFFGFNESFAGTEPAKVAKFVADYEAFLDDTARRHPRDDAKSPPRFVLVSPVAFEPTGDRHLPDGTSHNAALKVYAEAVAAVAVKRNLAFVDLYTPTLALFTKDAGMQFTINGAHLDERGDLAVAKLLDAALFGGTNPAKPGTTDYERLRAAVNDKAWVHSQDYRMVNGWYVYGGRRTFDTETFPHEYAKLRAMAAVRDKYVWDLASGRPVADKPDDSKTGELFVPPTRFGEPRQKYSEAEELRYLTPDEEVKAAVLADGLVMVPFADETKFPDIAKPVQLNFDSKGRLWLACMPNYPQWKPGDPRPGDKLVILEDVDGDGKADKSKVFYDKLHCPTGFEFFDGGVLVTDQPRLLFLKDTDGDDVADQVTVLVDGWATDDTHHTCGAFEWSNGGLLHMLEGIATSTTLETPWGPHRSQGAGGAYVFDPRTQRVRQFALPGMYNMWCYHFDQWGQGFVGDGTTPNMAWDTPLSGAQFSGRKGLNFLFGGSKGERPNIGSERLISRALPDDMQNQFVYAAVITMNGLPRFTLVEDGAGFTGKRVNTADGKPGDFLRSSNKHFRPADPQIGPDGALWIGDWANALIGHMQYSQRDPNRDHVRGRVYRIFAKDKPLLKPVTQHGKPVAEVLEQLKEYEWRTRYRARRDLRDRPEAELLAGIKAWLARQDPAGAEYDRLRCEALWLQQSRHAVDVALLKDVLKAKTPHARAAAVRILSDEASHIPETVALLKAAAVDEHPRVRTEAVRALSFHPTPEAMDGVFAAAKLPMDYWTRYTVESTLAANEAAWRGPFLTGKVGKDDAETGKILTGILAASKAGGAAAPHLKVLLSTEKMPEEQRNKAMTALATMKGNPTNGRAVFVRACTACHRVGNGEGREFGPNLEKVATRLPRLKLIESIIDPNAEINEKFLTTRLLLEDERVHTGLVVKETKDVVTIFDGKQTHDVPVKEIAERKLLKQSSMPEGAAASMAPVEFLDLIEYLASQK